MEREVANTRKGTMKLISMALEEAGIEFLNEEGWVGVRLNKAGFTTVTSIGLCSRVST